MSRLLQAEQTGLQAARKASDLLKQEVESGHSTNEQLKDKQTELEGELAQLRMQLQNSNVARCLGEVPNMR